MAFQIDEDKLSKEAKKNLNNAKNKSQFVRDAIEYYVKGKTNGASSGDGESQIRTEIQELKSLILVLAEQGIPKQTIKNTETEEITKSTLDMIKGSNETAATTDKPKSDVNVLQITPISESSICREEDNNNSSVVKGSEMSDERKKEIELMYDSALDFGDFGEE